jgi:putative flippase GtrA
MSTKPSAGLCAEHGHGLLHQLIAFGFVGILNTALGFGAIAVLTLVFRVDPFLANACGYVLGLINSFFMNRTVTFRKAPGDGFAALRFLIAFLLAYAANLTALSVLLWTSWLPPLAAQAAAMVFYTINFFVLSKWFVFRA